MLHLSASYRFHLYCLVNLRCFRNNDACTSLAQNCGGHEPEDKVRVCAQVPSVSQSSTRSKSTCGSGTVETTPAAEPTFPTPLTPLSIRSCLSSILSSHTTSFLFNFLNMDLVFTFFSSFGPLSPRCAPQLLPSRDTLCFFVRESMFERVAVRKKKHVQQKINISNDLKVTTAHFSTHKKRQEAKALRSVAHAHYTTWIDRRQRVMRGEWSHLLTAARS